MSRFQNKLWDTKEQLVKKHENHDAGFKTCLLTSGTTEKEIQTQK